jgi:basic membrane protein A
MFSRKFSTSIGLLILLIALALTVACGQPAAEEAAEPTAEEQQPAATETAAPAEDAEEAADVEPTAAPEEGSDTVGFIFPGVVNDGSFNTLGFTAMEGAQADLGFESTYAESVAGTDAPRVMGELIDGGAFMIWAHSGTFVDPVVATAADYPEVSFAVYTGSQLPDAPSNIWQIANVKGFRQIYCLAGVAAGTITSSNVIGFIGGIELPVYAQGRQMYERCAMLVNPDVEVLGSFTGDFDDAVKAKEAAVAQIEQGADVFAHSVNLGTYGILEAVQAADNVYMIGAAKDETELDPERYLTAVFIDYEQLMEQLIPRARDGELGGFYESTLEAGTAVLSPFTDATPQEVRDAVAQAQEQILAGEINLEPEG